VSSAARALTRDRMPDIKSAATKITATARTSHCLVRTLPCVPTNLLRAISRPLFV